ncbi:protease inhibitor I42 family protein [Eggerthella lenta]|uniref:protease inhibitor I42 family protein n=1 Tax=Eggerthella lenta TaxID=84112 RepID=UPI001896AFAB|nr:protease inhibitor I42 family protein [Eggerthella lenta]MDB1794079.1 protease inhibitor I42 family protein [Eggerthella lenta]
MTKTAKWSMIGVLAALVLALFAVAGCSSDNAGNNDNGGDNANPATENNDNGNGNNGDNNNGDNNNGNNNADNNNSNNGNNNNGNQMGDGSSIGEGTVLKVPNGWVAYSQSDMLVLLDSNADVQYQWTAEVNGNTVLKDTDADLPSSGFNDQNSQDVVGAAGMHAFGFLADDQNNGESTITMKLANTSNANDVKTTIVVKATVQNGTFTDVSVQE